MRDLCATFFGPIQMTDVVGAYLHVVLDTLLDKYYLQYIFLFFANLSIDCQPVQISTL
jgi:hypothetical protein